MSDVPSFKQIAVSPGAGEDVVDVVYGLDDDGRVWMRTISSESKGWIPIETNIHPGLGKRLASA